MESKALYVSQKHKGFVYQYLGYIMLYLRKNSYVYGLHTNGWRFHQINLYVPRIFEALSVQYRLQNVACCLHLKFYNMTMLSGALSTTIVMFPI